MRTYRPADSMKRARLPKEFLHSTFTIPSNFSGNYEGDVTMFHGNRNSPLNSKRHLMFHSDSDEEYSDTSPFDESRKTVETLRNRLFLYELSPDTSKVILKNVVYQKLVQLVTIIIFLFALIMLCTYDLLKQVVVYLLQKRSLMFKWNRSNVFSALPFVFALIFVYCYFSQSTCYGVQDTAK